MQNLIINITQENFKLLQREDLGCFLLSESLNQEFAAEFIKQAQSKGKLCLIYGSNAAEIRQNLGADGVVLDLSREENPQKQLKDFKAKNPKVLVGAISRNRRHEAMLISECEPEFIVFRLWDVGLEKSAELLKWYCDFFLIQCAIWPQEKSDFSKITTDFVIINDIETKL